MRGLLIFLTIILICCLAKCSPVELLPQKTQERKTRELRCPSALIRTEQGPQVFLTISSLAKSTKKGDVEERLLQLNWYNEEPREEDFVALYDHDPRDDLGNPVDVIKPREHPQVYTTNVTFPYVELVASNPIPTNRCLGFWIAYFRRTELLSLDCIKYNPTWMADLRSHIGDYPLLNLILPGVHDAGAYSRFKPGMSNLLPYKYTYTQDENTFNQLMYGLRYFDMRVAYYPKTKEKFWVNHGVMKIRPLMDVLNQVIEFIEATEEIVIFDIHELGHGFTPDQPQIKKSLVQFLEDRLGYRMASREFGATVTVNALWRTGKRLIVTGPSEMLSFSYLIWDRVQHKWGDVDDPDALFSYLNQIMSPQAEYSYFWSAMAELTPSEKGLVIDKYGGLRKMADSVNSKVTAMVRDKWWAKANIVAVDFFLGTNLIDVSITANVKRALCFSRLRNMPELSKTTFPNSTQKRQSSRYPNFWYGPRSIL